ncbi:hypothetical protein LX36DRAFT_303627 [Colletotrichum falcatum]|nr:hypothetical protein LX36DRAFT_303627 [Colletotrichum falcatum]
MGRRPWPSKQPRLILLAPYLQDTYPSATIIKTCRSLSGIFFGYKRANRPRPTSHPATSKNPIILPSQLLQEASPVVPCLAHP